jgi:cytochrome c oxidase assembly factor 4
MSESIHKGSKSTFKDVDINELIENSGCSPQYYALEECLGEYDRDWKKCQVQVKDLRSCNDKKAAKPTDEKKHSP